MVIQFCVRRIKKHILIYNQEVGRIEEDEIYSDFYSFLNDLSNLLGIKE